MKYLEFRLKFQALAGVLFYIVVMIAFCFMFIFDGTWLQYSLGYVFGVWVIINVLEGYYLKCPNCKKRIKELTGDLQAICPHCDKNLKEWSENMK